MFEISKLKDKTLVELQEIAKTIGAKKYSQLKKLDLVYLILDIQASVPTNVKKKEPAAIDGKARRRRIIKKANPTKEVKPSNNPQLTKEIKSESKNDIQISEKRKVVKAEIKKTDNEADLPVEKNIQQKRQGKQLGQNKPNNK